MLSSYCLGRSDLGFLLQKDVSFFFKKKKKSKEKECVLSKAQRQDACATALLEPRIPKFTLLGA